MVGVYGYRWRRRLRWFVYTLTILTGLSFSVTGLRTPDSEGSPIGSLAARSRGFVWWVPPWQADRLPKPAASAWFSVADGVLSVWALWPLLRRVR